MATEFETRRWNRTRPTPQLDVSDWPMITPEEAERRARNLAENKAAFERWMAGERPSSKEEDEMRDDYFSYEASLFKDSWNSMWSGEIYGSFEDTTKIPCMRFTDKKPSKFANLQTTLQVFALKVAEIRGRLQWPLHVFGKVALRDTVDHNRNMIFERTRDNCQIITPEGPYLKLIGPTRAVVLLDPVTFEVDLKVKGTTEDEDLSFLAVSFRSSTSLDSVLVKRDYSSKLSTLEFALGVLVYSVEATISMRVTSGSWPDGSRAQFAAYTASISREVVLLDSRVDKVPVDSDGSIMLSRRVVSAEVTGQLKVSVKAWQGDGTVIKRRKGFKPQEAGRSIHTLDLGFCKMDVTVAWSLISSLD